MLLHYNYRVKEVVFNSSSDFFLTELCRALIESGPFYILFLENKAAGSRYLALTVFIGSEPVRKTNQVFNSSRKGYIL